MNCYECGDTLREKTELLEIDDPYVGPIAIAGVPYYQCDNCDDVLYTEEMSRAIEKERNNKINKILNQLPISDFISAADTASILGISRQALHKNRRINHGFIYQTKFSGATVYLRISALMFKKNGDGRFPLYPYTYYQSEHYLIGTESIKSSPAYSSNHRTKVSKELQFQKTHRSLEENIYAN